MEVDEDGGEMKKDKGQYHISCEMTKAVLSPFADTSSGGDGPPLGDPSKFQLVRPMRASLNLLSQPNGSCKVWQGDSCVLAAVFGPSDVRISKELPHRAAVDVLFRPKVTGTSQFSNLSTMETLEERAIEAHICSIFESVIYLEDYPTRGFNIILHEYENDGCLLANCINAASLALLDGGCPLRSCVAAVTVFLANNQFIIDGSSAQTKNIQGTMVFAFASDDTVLFSKVLGRIPIEILQLGLKEARRSAEEVFSFFHFVLAKKAHQ